MASVPSRQASLRAYYIVWLVLPIVAVFLRFWSRWTSRKGGKSVGWDDWTALAALVFSTITTSFTIKMISMGLGKHEEDLDPSTVINIARWLFITELFYDISITLPKVSALLYYIRVFKLKEAWWRWTVLSTMFLVVAWLITLEIYTTFLCSPVQKQWNQSLPGHCHTTNNLWIVSAVPSVVIDFLILIMPMPMLYKLTKEFALKMKLAVLAVFLLGYCVIVISIGRLIEVLNTNLDEDFTWGSVNTFFWLGAEAPVSIISISLPMIFFLCRRCYREGPSGLFSSSYNISIAGAKEKFSGSRASSGSRNSGWAKRLSRWSDRKSRSREGTYDENSTQVTADTTNMQAPQETQIAHEEHEPQKDFVSDDSDMSTKSPPGP